MPPRKSVLPSLLISRQIKELIDKGKRIDGRGFHSYREITVQPNVIKKANGSAYVALGNTVVVAGVKFEVGTPFSDTPNEGVLIVEGEVLPIASFEAEPGPPTEAEVELSRVVDRGIRESGMIDLEKTVIVPGERVLKLFIDFSILNDAGNLIDVSNLAAVTALLCADYPDPSKLAENPSAPIEEIPKIPLPTRELPISVTLAYLFGNLVVDPAAEEELSMSSRLTITHTKNDEICSIQKSGSGDLPSEKVFEAIEIAADKSKELREVVLKAVGERKIA